MDSIHDMMRLGISAFNAGDKQTARQLFERVTQIDQQHQAAWLWLGAAVEDPALKLRYTDTAYRLNPQSDFGKRALQALQALQAKREKGTASSNQRQCIRCQRPIGIFEGLHFNRTTGRCGACEREVKQHLNSFRQAFLNFTIDTLLSDEEMRALTNYCDTHSVPLTEALTSIRADGIALLERALSFAFADGELTEGEERNIRQMQQTLQIPDRDIHSLLQRLTYLKNITAIRRGKLTPIKPSIHLDAGEIAYLEEPALFFKATKSQITPVPGRIIATNKQFHFVGVGDGWTIKLKNILRVVHEHNNITLELSVKRGAGRYSTRDPLKTEAIIDALVRMEKRQLLVPQNDRPSRHIPQEVRNAVWQRDQGRCVQCGATEYLEYDHVIPFSKGGASTVNNIQLLCRTCNLKKGDRI